MPTVNHAVKPLAPSHWETIVIGAFGGIFPTLLHFAIVLTADSSVNPLNLIDHNRLIGTTCGIVLFGVLGAGVAHVWQETDRKKVFYIGIGLPALIKVAVAGAPAPTEADWIDRLGGVVVRAQTVPAETGPTRLTLTLPGEMRNTHVDAVFRNNQGEIISAVPIVSDRNIQIPEGATTFNLASSLGDSGPKQIPRSAGVVSGSVSVQADSLYGFWSVVGFKGKPYKITISDLRPSPMRPRASERIGATQPRE